MLRPAGRALSRPPRLRHRPAPAHQPARRPDRVHQRQPPLATAHAGRVGAGDRSKSRFAVRLPGPPHLPGPVAGPAAGRPAGDADRRHAGAQRQQPRSVGPDRAHPRAASPRGRPHSDRGGRRRQPRPPGGRRDRHVPGLARRRPLRAGRRHGADLTDASDTPLRPVPGPAARGGACPADRVTGEGAYGGCPGAGRGGRSRRPEPPRR